MTILPLLTRSSNDLDDPAQKIDRTLDDRGHRLIAGISISEGFDRVDAVLVVAAGHGKYLRVKHVEAETQALPTALQNLLKEVTSASDPSIAEVRQLATDLALHQANVFETIKCKAGKYVDRILAIAVHSPDIRWCDFDGSRQQQSLCDPVRLSQLTGVTIIDDFPARDMAAGGTGQQLDALPWWFLHADRARKVAADHRLVLQFSNESSGYWLPASDGLDAELPNITAIGPTPSVVFLEQIVSQERNNDEVSSNNIEQESSTPLENLYAEGSRNHDLIDHWNQIWVNQNGESESTHRLQDIDLKLARSVDDPKFQSISKADIIRSAVVWMTDLVMAEISPVHVRADHVYFASQTSLTSCLINQFIQAANYDKSRVHTVGYPSSTNVYSSHQAVSAAVLGLLHIDQMPANVPALTGANEQRILGRLSMGKPSNWRQLLREMADFCPPAMKLRDAV
jgi:hypothetical protein